RFSILPALCLNGILACHIIEGSFNSARFKAFINGLLEEMQPFPGPNSVVIMDNARIHHDPEIVELVES
ncbi:hypothetical protein FOMPIDRAFT_1097293, partial [Fomitopsis schrenkii]